MVAGRNVDGLRRVEMGNIYERQRVNVLGNVV